MRFFIFTCLLAFCCSCSESLEFVDTVPGSPNTVVDIPSQAVNAQADSASLEKTAVAATGPAFWPNWLGPNHDGISSESGWSTDWPKTGLPTVWSARIGTGFSSMAIAENRLYAMGYENGQESVFCIDATNGEPLWRHQYECDLVNNLHEGGPGATPTIEGSLVYTLSRQGHLFCFDAASGDIQWAKQLERELDVSYPEWGFTSSPRIIGDLVIVDAGKVAAFDKRDGRLIWQTEKYKAGYGSAAIMKQDDKTLIAILNNQDLLILDANKGQKITTFPWKTQYETTSATPLVHGDTLFISSGYGQGCALLQLSSQQLKLVYENRNMRNHFNNSVLWQGELYGVDGNSHAPSQCKVVCLDHATGKVKWSQRGFGCGSLLVAIGKLIILSDRGDLVCAEASPAGYKELARAKVLSGRCWTVPVLAGGRIYCRNAKGDLVCVQLPEKT